LGVSASAPERGKAAAQRLGDQAIAQGRPSTAGPRHPTFCDAARTARLTEAVLRSARTRSRIEVS